MEVSRRLCGGREEPPSFLEVIGSELVESMVLSRLDATSLARASICCKAFRSLGPSGNSLRLVERVAKAAVLEANRGSLEEATRWSNMSWLERLRVEDSITGFDRLWAAKSPDAPDASGFKFAADPATGVPQILLLGMGPKLLLSDASTEDQPVLRWRLVVRGNTAVEFGVVPANLTYTAAADDDQSKVHKALHKCKHPEGGEFRENVGFSSAITVGSMLPFKVPLMKGSAVEVLAARGVFRFLVANPPDAQELFWSGAGHHARTVPKPYKGPARFAMEQRFDPSADVRLALTCWAQGVFDVLEPAPRALHAPAAAAAAAAGGACGNGSAASVASSPLTPGGGGGGGTL